MKIVKLIITLLFFILGLAGNAQVKTKTFNQGIPQELKVKTNAIPEIMTKAPTGFTELLTAKDGNPTDYSNRFSIPEKVDIDFLSNSKVIEDKEFKTFVMSVNAEKALNVSLLFSDFILPKNALLSIYTTYELTDSITSNVTNENNTWATRVYQGNKLTIALKIPIADKLIPAFKISKIFFGFKKFGNTFFGNPGASAVCNVNVLCAVGDDWENERNSVALISANGYYCTGSLVMNTYGRSTPYFLTADHCLDAGNVSNWVFQFQYWGASCSSNAGYREDIQFNGCNLRANNATTDFALLELNSAPLPNSGIHYSGWDRSTGVSNGSVGIHHPAGDLMKFCKDFDNVSESSWGGSNNHWVSIFELGTVQPGSSGSPLYNMNNRIIGQLHGDQQNRGNYCLQRRGEYGKFNASWTGGGTPSTRLSDWLDPSNSGAMTTNTTNIACLNSFATSISGPSTFCSNGGGSYTVSPVPAGATVTWQAGGLNITSGQGTPTIGVSATGFGSATIQAIVTTSCGISYPMASFSVFVNAGPGVGINYTSNNGAVQNLLYYYNIGGDVEEEIVNVNVNGVCLGYTSRGYLSYNPSPGTTVTFTAVRGLSLSFRTSRSVFLNLSVGTVGYVRVSATNNCGTDSFLFAFKLENCGIPNYPNDPNPPDPCNNPPRLYNISPNPASGQIKIGISAGISEKPMDIPCPRNPNPKINAILNSKDGITFSEVNIYNSFGILVLSKQMDKAKEFVIPLNELRAGLYLIQISEGEYIERHQIIIE